MSKNVPDNLVTEEKLTEITIESDSKGITEYPILDFDLRALKLLYRGVKETLRYTKIKPRGGEEYERKKRFFDVVVSLIALIILFIPFGIVSLLIYLQDGGNPIFTQIRLTKNGKPFKMYKFRSMCIDAEEKFKDVQKENQNSGLAFKADDDPRITKLGKILRKTSIDELPQFINVLKGDMSLIGPRPPLPREVVLYTPHEMDRLLVKGGLACICQTEGRSDMDFDEWVDSDIEYIKNRSLALDAGLVVKMVIAVLLRKGAK